MKTSATPSRHPAQAKSGADNDLTGVWHPTVVEFTGGLEVTEVLDSIPGELLELFKATESSGKP
jgi:hypothetical protein